MSHRIELTDLEAERLRRISAEIQAGARVDDYAVEFVEDLVRSAVRSLTVGERVLGGVYTALADVRAFMTRGQPDQIAQGVQPIRGCDLRDTRGDVLRVADDCALHGNTLRSKSFDNPEVLSLALLTEELGEVAQALADGDVAAYADGLVDLIYVALGAGIRAGIPLDRVWTAVHAANMAKFPTCPECGGEGSSPESIDAGHRIPHPDCAGRGFLVYRNEAGKVVKPPGWTPPDIAVVLGVKA